MVDLAVDKSGDTKQKKRDNRQLWRFISLEDPVSKLHDGSEYLGQNIMRAARTKDTRAISTAVLTCSMTGTEAEVVAMLEARVKRQGTSTLQGRKRLLLQV